MQDEELAGRCLRGDDEAWETLVGLYQRKVWNVAYHFTGRAAEADELTQEIFLHVLGALRSFHPGSSLQAWLLRVARNYSIDHYRKGRRERALTVEGEDDNHILQQAPSQAADPQVALEQKDLSAWIRSALNRLPEEIRQAVSLRDLQEMSYEEIAQLLDVPLGTVKSRINRGRLEIARQLKRRRAGRLEGEGTT
ncbi:MAG: RNA polymerase sigma factor [Acidobacteriota bacterium]